MHAHDDPGDFGPRKGRGRGRATWRFEGPFGPTGPGPWDEAAVWGRGPFGPGGHGMWSGHRGRGWGRARRGDVRSAVLALLAERPMHGYEIISQLSERTEGMWRPSPGSIYPTLQLLEDEGLVAAVADSGNGKRRFALTDEGRRTAGEVTAGPAPWDEVASGTPGGTRALVRAAATLVPVVRQVAVTGSQKDCEEAAALLEETRRRLYGILAGTASGTETPDMGPTSAGI